MIFGADVAGAVAVFVLIPITIQRRAQPATPETTIAAVPHGKRDPAKTDERAIFWRQIVFPL